MSIDIKDCNPMNVFRDETGRLFRVIGFWTEPVVYMKELRYDGTEGERMMGGISGLMWRGFKRLKVDGDIDRP